MNGTVEYHSNNSGGDWWLEDKDWYALARAGWDVEWFSGDGSGYKTERDGKWLGALASRASKKDTTLREAIVEWESVTGQQSNALGCGCCGVPHSFSYSDELGNHDYYAPTSPEYGDLY